MSNFGRNASLSGHSASTTCQPDRYAGRCDLSGTPVTCNTSFSNSPMSFIEGFPVKLSEMQIASLRGHFNGTARPLASCRKEVK